MKKKTVEVKYQRYRELILLLDAIEHFVPNDLNTKVKVKIMIPLLNSLHLHLKCILTFVKHKLPKKIILKNADRCRKKKY